MGVEGWVSSGWRGRSLETAPSTEQDREGGHGSGVAPESEQPKGAEYLLLFIPYY